MSTCLETLTRAFRYMGVIEAGQAPAGTDLQDGMQQLQDVINSLPLLRNGQWDETILSSAAAYDASDGERINAGTYAATITLPTTYEDECGNTLPTIDLARVQVIGANAIVDYGGTAGGAAGLYIWSASNGAWRPADGLTSADDVPFGPEDDQRLAALVAVAMVDEYGSELSDAVVGRAVSAVNYFRARFYRDVTVSVDRAYLRMSNMGERFAWDPLA